MRVDIELSQARELAKNQSQRQSTDRLERRGERQPAFGFHPGPAEHEALEVVRDLQSEDAEMARL